MENVEIFLCVSWCSLCLRVIFYPPHSHIEHLGRKIYSLCSWCSLCLRVIFKTSHQTLHLQCLMEFFAVSFRQGSSAAATQENCSAIFVRITLNMIDVDNKRLGNPDKHFT